MADGTSLAKTAPPDAAMIEQVVLRGDLKGLGAAQKTAYYSNVCQSLGLNPLTQPFEFIVLNGKERLYAKKDCTDQLRKIHCITINITSRERVEDLYVVTAKARMPDGREDESTGAVTIGGKKGDDLANALMKAETKAKRRATLSICGLGLLDETEMETIPVEAQREKLPRITTHAEPDEDPDATGDAELQAHYMARMEEVEQMVGDATTWEQCEACREIIGSRAKSTAFTSAFRRDRFARKLGPADEREFSKAWQRMNRQLCKKEEALDPGSAAEIIAMVNADGEVVR